MTSLNIPLEDFPSLDPSKRTKWAPIVLHPKEASLEKFVVGIVAVDDEGYHVEVANRLSRLACLYGDQAVPITLAVEIAVSWLEEVLADGNVSLPDIKFPVSNVSLGRCEGTIGVEREAVAQQWMATLSSFYEESEQELGLPSLARLAVAKNTIEARRSRLSVQVFGIIEKQEPNLLQYFHEDVRKRSQRRARASARVKIDYDGMRLSANIDGFDVDAPAKTVGILKQRMWDLSIQRERNAVDADWSKDFEMLVDFPQYRIADKKPASVARIQEHVRELTAQADSEQIRLRTMPSPYEISNHILEKEAA